MTIQSLTFLRGWPPVFLWMAFTFGLSSIPGDTFSKVLVPNVSGMAHAIEYSILGILLFRGFMRSLRGKTLLLSIFLAFGSAVLFGISDEWHQTFVSGRFFELEDLTVDALAAILGILLYIKKTGLSLSRQ
jgi:VanZ family protein